MYTCSKRSRFAHKIYNGANKKVTLLIRWSTREIKRVSCNKWDQENGKHNQKNWLLFWTISKRFCRNDSIRSITEFRWATFCCTIDNYSNSCPSIYRIETAGSGPVFLTKKTLFLHDFICYATVISAFYHYTGKPTECFKGALSLPFIEWLRV